MTGAPDARCFWRAALLLGLGLAAGCSQRHPDPPPPALSGGLASAPPGALGARAASRPAPAPVTPTAEVPSTPPSPFLPPHPGHPALPPPGRATPDAGGPGVSL